VYRAYNGTPFVRGGAKYFTSWVLLGFWPPTHPPKNKLNSPAIRSTYYVPTRYPMVNTHPPTHPLTWVQAWDSKICRLATTAVCNDARIVSRTRTRSSCFPIMRTRIRPNVCPASWQQVHVFRGNGNGSHKFMIYAAYANYIRTSITKTKLVKNVRGFFRRYAGDKRNFIYIFLMRLHAGNAIEIFLKYTWAHVFVVYFG
jgi:hypothetical protein